MCAPLSDADLSLIDLYRQGSRSFKKGVHIYHEGDVLDLSFSLASGWVLLYHLLEDGRRQGLEVLLPGSFFGFRANLQTPMTHAAVCLTDVTVCSFQITRLQEFLIDHPTAALHMLRQCARDRLLLHDHIVNLGRRTSRERVGHFLVQVCERLLDRHAGDADAVALPINQQVIADILGLSVVHTNRVLHGFKEEGFVATRRGKLLITDSVALGQAVGLTPEGV